ncbi:MAG: hypothetical protein BWY61_00758 [Firmicutes bacterium ADurb.Bin354]|nr:MAG: hypothetical protein BWY61_00758 [Firmicutes bacterium ADurb.Bin354]
MHAHCIKPVTGIYPCHHASVFSGTYVFSCKSGCDNRGFSRLQIDIIEITVYIEIAVFLTVGICLPCNIVIKKLACPVIRNEYFLFNGIQGAVIIINGYSVFTFVYSAVHISIYDKTNIARFINAEYPYIIVTTGLAPVCQIIIVKTENISQSVLADMVYIQTTGINKSKSVSVLAFHHIHILIRDTENDLIIGKYPFLGIKYLIHGPLVIEEEHPSFTRSQSETLIYIEFPCLIILWNGNDIIKLYHCRILVIDKDLGLRFCKSADFKSSPAYLIQTGMDIHFLICRIVAFFVTLKICNKLLSFAAPVKCKLVEVIYKFKLILKGRILFYIECCIEIYLSVAFILKDHAKRVLPVFFQKIL